MRDFSRSGDFGEVRFFDVCIPSGKLRSTDRICMAGWHKVNGLYRQERKTGLPFGILLFTVGGTGSVCVDGKKTSVHAGEIALIPSGKAHSYMGTDDTWEFYWLHYLGDHAALCAEDITAQNDFVFNVGEKTVRMLTAELFGAKKQSIEQEIADSESLQNLMLLLLKRARIASADAVTEEMLKEGNFEAAENTSTLIASLPIYYSEQRILFELLLWDNEQVPFYLYCKELRIHQY